MKYKYNHRKNFDIYFVRDNNKNEVDLILEGALSQIGIEIKSGQSFNPDLLKGLDYWQNLPSRKNKFSYLIYAGAHEQQVGQHQIFNWQKINHIVATLDQ